MSELIMFHGRECPHCHVMMPLVDRLEQEEGIKLEKKEIWHNREMQILCGPSGMSSNPTAGVSSEHQRS